MPRMVLLATLDRLPAYDEPRQARPESLAFGLSLSVALGEGVELEGNQRDALHRQFLQPWSWGGEGSGFRWPDRVTCFLRRRWGDQWHEVPAELNGPEMARSELKSGSEPAFERLKESLAQRYEELEGRWRRDATSVAWRWPSGELDAGARPWPAFVGELSQYPWPLAQALGLAYFFRLPWQTEELGEFEDYEMAAVPEMELDGDRLVPCLMAHESELRFTYVLPNGDLPDSTLVAVTRVEELHVPEGASEFFDRRSLWIRRPKPVARRDVTVFDDDWRATLEDRMAERLHLAPVIADWLGDREVSADPPALVRLALERLKDATGPGSHPDTPGASLVRLAADGEPEPVIRTAEEGLSRWYRDEDLEEWQRRVLDAVEDLTKNENAGAGYALFERPEILTPEEALAALRQLETALAQPSALERLVGSHWRDAAPPDLPQKAQQFVQRLAGTGPPAGVDLRRRLLRSQLGAFWPRFLRALDHGSARQNDLASVQRAVRPALEKHLTELCRRPDGEAVVPEERIEELAADVLADLFPHPDAVPKAPPRARESRGISVQVDTLGPERRGDDYLEKIQGVALLMRRADPAPGGPWRCLHRAAARRKDDAGGVDRLAEPVLLPSRLSYANGLRNVTLTYDNQPLTVEGPLAWASSTRLAAAPEDPLDRPLVRYVYSTREAARIPGLVYGRTYEILPFQVANCGAVPWELAADPERNPWRLKDPLTLDGFDTSGIRREAPYRRKVAIGSLRLVTDESGDGGKSEIGLPPIPEGVVPRIREAEVERGLAGGRDARETPLLFLVPQKMLAGAPGLRHEFAFRLRPPATDVHTWDRWIAADDGAKDRRKRIWASFYELADQNSAAETNLVAERAVEGEDLTLDDPAVSGMTLTFERLDVATKSAKRATFEDRPEPGGMDLHRPELVTEQREALRVEVRVGEEKPAEAVESIPGGFRIRVEEGGIYRLSFRPLLHDGAAKRFANDDLAVAAASHLLIEVAEPLLPGSANGRERTELKEKLQSALWERLAPRRGRTDQGEVFLELGAEPEDGLLARLARHAYRAEILHQSWGWRGRPPAPHPDLSSVPASLDAKLELERYVEWEIREFGERADFQHRREPAARTAVESHPEFRYLLAPEVGAASDDLGAVHHRFGIRVFSRYEKLLPEDEGFVDSYHVPSRTRWRRLFVPCRHRGRVPPPAVRLVLPRTEESGFLVVVDGPWYRVGGLAEELLVEVVAAAGPVAGRGPVHEAGSDPIVTAEPLLRGYRALPVDEFDIRFDVEGAIGHHRDRTDEAPRFLASSFLVGPPKIEPEDAGLRTDWMFLKLQFRRRLKVATSSGLESRDSGPSAAFWVQLLPSFSRVGKDWFHSASFGAGDLDIVFRRNGQRIEVCERDSGEEVLLRRRSGFELYLAVFRRVTDITGRTDQQTFLGIWYLSGQPDGRTVFLADEALGVVRQDDRLRVQLLEVQRRAGSPAIRSGPVLWKSMLRTDVPDAERGRIVRMSRYFDVDSGDRR